MSDVSVKLYAKFVGKVEEQTNHNEEEFKTALEFHKFIEGKRPIGNCIIWGCTKKTSRHCKCGCGQFVCRDCTLCLLSINENSTNNSINNQ
jgi:hypothetical protein